MVLINIIFGVFSLLWLIGQIADAEVGSNFWFALAFTLLCAANAVNLLGRRKRRSGRAGRSGLPMAPAGEPLAERPETPQAYGVLDAGEGLMAWSEADRRLADARAYWVCTTRPDGRPHAAPVWGVWLDGIFYFGTHHDSRKARNLAANPQLIMHLDSSEQVVIVDGPAQEIGDPRLRARVDRAYATKYDLPADASAEDTNPIFALRPRLAFAWTGSDFAASATRWTFES